MQLSVGQLNPGRETHAIEARIVEDALRIVGRRLERHMPSKLDIPSLNIRMPVALSQLRSFYVERNAASRLANQIWKELAPRLNADRTRAFQVIDRDDEVTIAYDENGVIRSFPTKEKVKTSQIQSQNRLSQANIEWIKQQFYEHVERTRYNNAAMTLEFMGFLREARKQNPDLSMDDAFTMFQLVGSNVVEKYGGGNCFALAQHFHELMAEHDVQSYLIGNQGFNAALMLPGKVPWFEALQYVERAHGSLVVPYLDENGQQKFLHLETGVGHQMPPQVHDPSGLEGLKQSMSYVDPQLRVDNPSSVIKNQLRTRNKLWIMRDVDMQEMVGIDMLKGKITTRGDVSGVEQQTGQSGIDFKEVMANPLKLITLTINGQAKQMTQVAALILFLEVVQQEFKQPASFVQDVLTLIQCRDEYRDTFVLGEARPHYQ